MERNQILVIGGACVVIGFIGLQIMSGGHDDEGMPLAHTRRAADGRGANGDDTADEGYQGKYALGGRTSGGGDRGGSSDHGRGAAGSRYSDTGNPRRDSNSRSAQTLLAGRTNRGGTVGAGGSTGGVGGSGGSGVFSRGGTRQLEGGAPGRSDVVELLASQPASGRSQNGGNDNSGSEGDVALELKRPEDADSAGVKKDIQTPDSQGDGLTFTEGSKLAFPDGGNVNGEAGTISFQIEPNWNGNDETNNSLVTLRSENGWSNRLELVKNGRYLRFILADNVGREADISVPIDAWTPGEAHDVRATWGDQKTALFIDGAKVGENTYTEFVRPDAPLYVGSDHNGSTYSGANSTLRNFKVTNSSNFSG